MSGKVNFCNLHSHDSIGSPFDGFGFPEQHLDFAFENGMDSMALTNHGNCNSLPHQLLHVNNMRAQGKKFKGIFGIEAYFIDSIEDWKEAYEEAKKDKKVKKSLNADDGMSIEDDNRDIKGLLNKRNHLILLVQNQRGLNNLFKLISDSFKPGNFYRYPRMDFAALARHSEGIIASSACCGGNLGRHYWEHKDKPNERELVLEGMKNTSLRMREIYGNRWFHELQWNKIPAQNKINKYVMEVARDLDVPLLSTADSHYPNPEAWKDRELYKRLGWIGKSNKPEWLDLNLPVTAEELEWELYPKNGEQMWKDYKKYSSMMGYSYDDDIIMESIEQSYLIAHEMIEDFEPETKVNLPSFVVPEGKSAQEALEEFCFQGIKAKGLADSKTHMKRLKVELDVVKSRGFAKYFLTMNEVAKKANESMLAGPARGSAAGALMSYVLDITQIDPLKYDLQFERFMMKGDTSYADIDYDVSAPMVLKEQLIEEWGQNSVVPISNFNTLKLRSLIKDVSKFYDIPFHEVNVVTSRMMGEATPIAKKKHGITAGVYTPTFGEVVEYSDSLRNFLKKYPKVKEHIVALHGHRKSCSRHAGGVILGENLDEKMPLINSGGVIQTPWCEGQNVRHLEPMGFIKFDILGLTTLEMFENCIYNILRRHEGIDSPKFKDVKSFYDKNLHPDTINFDDQKVWKHVFHDGNFVGTFQMTQSGAQRFCMEVKPTSLTDFAAVTSIFRPGALSAKVHEKYIEARKEGRKDFPHPIVADVLKDTQYMIFQEQLAMIAHKLGKNLSLDEGNLLRKVLTKKGTGKEDKVKTKLHKKFFAGCREKKIEESEIEKLWQEMMYFSGYSFNSAHAISYSAISFQCAWLWHYYPSEWMAAFLSKEPEARKEAAINIAKAAGFHIEPVSINLSERDWTISPNKEKTLVQPLNSIKGLGDVAIDEILNNRPFDVAETLIFNENIKYSKLNKKALDALIRAGACNDLIDKRFSGNKHFWSVVAVDRPKTKKKFNELIPLYEPEGSFTSEEELINISSLTGMYPYDKVIAPSLQKKLKEKYIMPISDYDKDLQLVWFIVREKMIKKTQHGKEYWILQTIDGTGNTTGIKCWGVRPKDNVELNKIYVAKLDYDEKWGFSTRSIRRNFRRIG